MERRQILDRIMRLEARLTAPGAQGLDGMPHGSGSGDAMARGVAALADLRELYRTKEVDLTQTLIDIEHLIEGLDPVERLIARYRYIDGLQWEKICVKISYSWRQTHRLHDGLLEKLARRQAGEETVENMRKSAWPTVQ
jgi:hypothetical protein